MPPEPGGAGRPDPVALLTAIEVGDEDAARGLIAAHPDLARHRPGGASLVRRAGRADMADLLDDLRGLDELDVADAATVGDVERVQTCLEADPAALDAAGSDGYTPLHVAAWFGQVKVAELLLNRGAAVDAVSANAHAAQAINVAASRSQTVMVHLLLDHGADADAAMAGGFRPLHAASDNGQVEILRLLLERGADPNARNDAGHTPVDVAHDDAVRTLLASL